MRKYEDHLLRQRRTRPLLPALTLMRRCNVDASPREFAIFIVVIFVTLISVCLCQRDDSDGPLAFNCNRQALADDDGL